MKAVTYNIQYGLGKDTRYDLARIAGEVEDADIIALQEVDRHWQRSGCVDAPAVLASHLPEHHWVYGPTLDMDASYRSPDGGLVNRRRQFGNMILSRAPIVSSRNHLLPKYGTLVQHSLQQGALEAVIVTERAGPVRIYSVQLSHLSPATRMPQIEALLDVHARAPAEGGAWCGGHPDPAAGWTEGKMPPMPADALLMGDFNFESPEAEYDRIVGPRSARFGRLNRLTGFVDAWVAAGHREDDGETYGAAGGWISASCRRHSRAVSSPVASVPTRSARIISRSGSTWISEGQLRFPLARIVTDATRLRRSCKLVQRMAR